MSHTPGPWGFVYDGSSDWSIGPAADPHVPYRIALSWCPHYRQTFSTVAGVPVADVPADVRLIAAAPELLGALKAVIALEQIDLFVGNEDIATQIKVAIAKAEGR